jgi:EAL domain-containing protein (putative c-di-GMP-specific phosphodiesterase class I)
MENYASLLDATLRNGEAERLQTQAKAIRARHAEELLTRRWSALPVSADKAADEDPPDWVTRLSAAAATSVNGSSWRVPGPHAGSTLNTHQGREAASGVATLMAPSASASEQLEDDLRRALERNELQVYYQPVVSLASGQITGAEALIRWQHPRRGLLSPQDFVPLAEETGLIGAMGERLLRDACAQRTTWSEAGDPEVRLLVNLSQREFQDQRLPDLIRDVLRATQTTPSALQLEITERVALQDLPFTIEALQALKATGVRIALDDAGTDPSLRLHLGQLPIDAVKLHGALVRRTATDPETAGVVEATTDLARSVDLQVIALGVETEEQLAVVRELRCDEAQGYLFRRAAPAELFAMLLQTGESLAAEAPLEERDAPDRRPGSEWPQ